MCAQLGLGLRAEKSWSSSTTGPLLLPSAACRSTVVPSRGQPPLHARSPSPGWLVVLPSAPDGGESKPQRLRDGPSCVFGV
jgi:hypothetical protein